MVLSRSFALLRIAYRNTDKTTNFNSHYFLKNVKFCTQSTSETAKTEIPVERNLSKDVTPVSGGYTKESVLENQINEKCSDHVDSTAINSFHEPEQINTVRLLENNVPELDDSLNDFHETLPKPLDKCTEDISHIGPYWNTTHTFAKFANESHTLQQLIKLGVPLYKFESQEDVMQMFLTLDFDKDMKPYIQFLHNCGVPADDLARFITKNPKIFKEDMDDLHTRIRYLRAHNFTIDMIKVIMYKNPKWLSFSTKDIDGRLGFFQNTFDLSGSEIRCLTVKHPSLITLHMQHIRENTFAVKEEMGFNGKETKLLLLRAPRIWSMNRYKVLSTFDYLHNQMKLSHDLILKEPDILRCRKSRLEQRHKFLVELKRDQFDPLKPMYVSPLTLVSGNDIEFCRNVAKTHIDLFNMFLKTF